MDATTIEKLRLLDETFYRENAASFASTRQYAWPGWERVAGTLVATPSSVLDMACGNARFKSFVDDRFGEGCLLYYGVDSCSTMLPDGSGIDYQNLDIIGSLLEDRLSASLEAPACDLTVCFGFMHHVPTNELRMALLDALIDKTAQGGTLAISFWQFADDPNMLEKARVSTIRGCEELGIVLDEGDYFLGWNNAPSVYRYCHSFTDAELDAFAEHCEGRVALVDYFKADGKTGKMNSYVVLQKP